MSSISRQLTLDEIKKSELEVLIAFGEFCKVFQLKYSLIGGTLLGAVRHKGFIPWDDDIDVAMPRPDFERLLALAPYISEQSDYLIEGSPRKSLDKPLFVKFMSKRVKVREYYSDTDRNLWVDILPMDGLPSTDEETERVYRRADFYRQIVCTGHGDPEHGTTKFRQITKKAFQVFDRPLHISDRFEKRLYGLARKRDVNDSNSIGVITWGLYGAGERIPRESYDAMATMEFEGYYFPVISSWNDYLSGVYGNYMQLPPVEERQTHNMVAWIDENE